jgi:FkbM family methyltransferase
MKRIFLRIYTLVFCRPHLKLFNEMVAKLGLNGLGLMLPHDDPTLNGEAFILRKVVHTLKVSCIFDIGANKGSYSELALAQGFKGNIYAFEPHPVTYKLLQKNLPYSNVKTFELGFSATDGKATIFDHSKEDGSEHASLYEEVIKSIHADSSCSHEVNLTTIDKFMSEHQISTIGLLKIDTEGSEYDILVGAKEALKQKKIDVIHFEFNSMNVVSRVFVKDFITLLKGYQLYRLLPNNLLRIDYDYPLLIEIFNYQNLIAIRQDLNITL